MRRRDWLRALPAAWLPASLAARADAGAAGPDADPAPPAQGVSRRPLRFPADHGAHPDTHVEWWYVTGWMRPAANADRGGAGRVDGPPAFGFQVTFFRTRTGLAETSPSRFAARQLVFAHAALTDLGTDGQRPRVLHDQRAARTGFGLASLPGMGDMGATQAVRLRDWSLVRAAPAPAAPTALRIAIPADRFALELALTGTQPLLLQGDAGYSRKAPDPRAASHYYSEPQLALRGRVTRAGTGTREVVGRAWLDHEWSDLYVPPESVGWDWLGVDLDDGGALMAFRLRRPDGSALWAGGTLRDAAGRVRTFGPDEVVFRPLRQWTSPRTQARYPVEWSLSTPAGRWLIAALLDDQELDSRASTGAVYWEGLAALRSEDGRVAGWGYLELTGYLERLEM